MMARKSGLEAVTLVKEALEKAGLPRTSTYNGAELRGWTTHFGSTGFSVRRESNGELCWHVVVSGRPVLAYDQGEDCHKPVRPESLNPRIKAVLVGVGLEVRKVRCTGWQAMWDDDVCYEVVTGHPDWLEGVPAAVPSSSTRW